MFALKLIPVLWVMVLLGNLLTKRLASELMAWYSVYSIIVGVLTTAFLASLAVG